MDKIVKALEEELASTVAEREELRQLQVDIGDLIPAVDGESVVNRVKRVVAELTSLRMEQGMRKEEAKQLNSELPTELAAVKQELEVARSQEPVAEHFDDGTPEGGLRWVVHQGHAVETGAKLYAAPVPPVAQEPVADTQAALNLVRMIRQEIPKTMGEFNLHLLMDDLAKIEKLLTSTKAKKGKKAKKVKKEISRLRKVMFDAWQDTDWLLIANEVHDMKGETK